MRFDVTMLGIAREWITPVIAVLGFGLGLWNRYDKWREDQSKAKASQPFANIDFSGKERVIDQNFSWRVIQITFTNSGNTQWRVNRIEIVEPKECSISREQDAQVWAEALDVDWVIHEKQDAPMKTQGRIELLFRRLNPLAPLGAPREIALRFHASEVSSRRRRATIDARMVRHF